MLLHEAQQRHLREVPKAPEILVNKPVVDFRFDFDEGTPLPVGDTPRDVVCVGNGGMKTVKLQVLWTQSEWFEVTFTPKVLVHRKGCAGEMPIPITS